VGLNARGVIVGENEVSRKSNCEVFDELGEWEGAIRVRPRWHEHESHRSHAPDNEQKPYEKRPKHRRRPLKLSDPGDVE